MTPEQRAEKIKLINSILSPLGFVQYFEKTSLIYRHGLLDLSFDLSAVNTEPEILMKHILVQFIKEGKERKLQEIQNILGIPKD